MAKKFSYYTDKNLISLKKYLKTTFDSLERKLFCRFIKENQVYASFCINFNNLPNSSKIFAKRKILEDIAIFASRDERHIWWDLDYVLVKNLNLLDYSYRVYFNCRNRISLIRQKFQKEGIQTHFVHI